MGLGWRMAGVETDFLRLAEECFRLAQQVKAPDTKLLLLDMAQAWLTLATDIEKLCRHRLEQTQSPG